MRFLDLTEGMAGSLAQLPSSLTSARAILVCPTGAVAAGPSQRSPAGQATHPPGSALGPGLAEVRRLTPSVDIAVVGLAARMLHVAMPTFRAQSGVDLLRHHGIRSDWPVGQGQGRGRVGDGAGRIRGQAGWHAAKKPAYFGRAGTGRTSRPCCVQGVVAAHGPRAHRRGSAGLYDQVLLAVGAERAMAADGEELPSEASGVVSPNRTRPNMLPHHRDPRQVNLMAMTGRWIVHSHTEPHSLPARIPGASDWIWQDEKFKGAPYQFPNNEAKAEFSSR